MIDFFELLQKRRSIRDFQEKEVPNDLVFDILQDSCQAPSSSNGQPWNFIVIHDREGIKELSDEAKKNLLSTIEKNPDSPLQKYEEGLRNPNFNVFYNAPCLVYIVGPKSVRTIYVDCTLAACYFMFSAAARGLGTCWVNLGSDIRDLAIRNKLGLSEDLAIVAPIILGYPRRLPAPPVRNEPRILKVLTKN
jgi:nitroreductase